MEEHTSETSGNRVSEHRGYRSLFWPVLFIGAGAIWLLTNLNIIPGVSLGLLLRLWPLLLIIIGLDILFGRSSPVVGVLIGLGAIALIIALVFVAPSQGWDTEWRWWQPGRWFSDLETLDVQTERFSSAIDDATSADVTLDLSLWETTVDALPTGSENLIEADIAYVGEPVFDVRGDENRSITVGVRDVRIGPNISFETDEDSWDISLSPDVPIDLTVNASLGRNTLDLRDLQLSALRVDGSLGETELLLPETSEPYEVDLTVSAGGVSVDIPDGANVRMVADGGLGALEVTVGENAIVELEVEMSAGSFSLDVGDGAQVDLTIPESGLGGVSVDAPDGAGVRLEVHESGLGSVQVPSDFEQLEGADGRNGVWESPNFDDAESRIVIVVDQMGAGSVVVR